jgi:lipopolysaccharide transport system permease protein
MVGVLDGARWSLVGGPSPGADVLASGVATLALLVLGVVYFQRTERQFADFI